MTFQSLSFSSTTDMTPAHWKISLGCELQPVLFESIPTLRSAHLVDHLQVTIPSTITCHQALEITAGIPVIAHCNLLNTFGANDWRELSAVARQVRSLKPVHVVEHFTAFRTQDHAKHGVCFTPEILRDSQDIIDRINRWQDTLGLPLCIENVPVASGARAYFNLLLKTMAATGCRIACDVPHFLLSVHAAEMADSEISSLAESLDPLQLHVGGLTVNGGILRDNHKVFSPWTAARARELFSGARYVTLEQNHQIPPTSVERYLMEIRRIEPLHEPQPQIISAQGIEQVPLNQELAAESAKNNGYAAPVRELSAPSHDTETVSLSALDLYEKYLPFLYPVESIQQAMNQLEPAEAVQMVTSLARWSLSYLSWWSPAAPAYVRITYGEGGERKFSKTIGIEDQDKFAGSERGFRFASRKGYWVEAAAPYIPELAVAEIKGA